MAWSAVGHIVFAALGTFALCRALGATRAGSVAGAVTFATTFAVPSLYIPSFLEAGAWLPFAGLALVRVVSAGGLWWTAVLGMAQGTPLRAASGRDSLLSVAPLGVLAATVLVLGVYIPPPPNRLLHEAAQALGTGTP